MDYRNKKVAITGVDGFLGNALGRKLSDLGADITILDGDIRDINTFNINYSYSYLFHFAAPSSQVLFQKQPMYCVETTINGFINAAKVCRETGTKLIYPSTGLLSQNRFNEYAMCKKICEDIHKGGVDALGLRIFATYGAGEKHKRDIASVPYLFARSILNGKSPEVFGDGEQRRDFIYIDDCANAIVKLAEEAEGVIDVGSGNPISFNKIVGVINNVLGTDIKPKYIPKPDNYVNETCAHPNKMLEYYQPKVSFEQGMKEVICELQSSPQL